MAMPIKARTNRVLGVGQVRKIRPAQAALRRFSSFLLSRALESNGVKHLAGTRVSRPLLNRKRGLPRRTVPVRVTPQEKPKPVKITFTPKRK